MRMCSVGILIDLLQKGRNNNSKIQDGIWFRWTVCFIYSHNGPQLLLYSAQPGMMVIFFLVLLPLDVRPYFNHCIWCGSSSRLVSYEKQTRFLLWRRNLVQCENLNRECISIGRFFLIPLQFRFDVVDRFTCVGNRSLILHPPNEGRCCSGSVGRSSSSDCHTLWREAMTCNPISSDFGIWSRCSSFSIYLGVRSKCTNQHPNSTLK
jgi:hypothetical protein